jgi:hypothetical protein
MTLHDFRSRHRVARAALLVAGVFIAAALWGCGKDNVASPKRVPLTLQAQGVGAPAQRYAAAAALSGTLAQDTIPVTFTRALITVRDVRFVMAEGEEESDTLGDAEEDSTGAENDSTDAERDDEGQVRFHGPFVIDLLAGTAQDLGTQLVPAGVYSMVMGHLQALAAGGALATQFPDLVGSTILLEGDIAGDGGGHFVYKARIDDEFIIHGQFNVQGDKTVTSFLVFDLSKLLQGRDGHFLDPRNPDNDTLIRQAIRHAIKVGIDRNHDGEPDDGLEAEAD